jgi:hypothetical protein
MGVSPDTKAEKNSILIRKAQSKDGEAIARVLIDSFPDKFVAIFGEKLKERVRSTYLYFKLLLTILFHRYCGKNAENNRKRHRC